MTSTGLLERAQNGWTGGQYSVLRIVLAAMTVAFGVSAWLVEGEGSALQRWAAVGLLVLVCLPLALGFLDRQAALALCGLLLLHRFMDGQTDVLAAWPAFESILLLHAFVPPSPYGAWSARGRPDPAGGWRLTDRLHDIAWLVVGLSHLLAGLAVAVSGIWFTTVTPFDWAVCALNLAFLPLSLVTRLRPLALCLGLVTVALGPLDGSTILAVGAHLACFTPAWLAPRPGPAHTLLYDGACGLCHRSVRFFLAEDPTGDALVYSPLDSPAARALLTEAQRAALPDSLALVGTDGGLSVRSTAVIRCLDRVGGGWRLVGGLMWLVPRVVRDMVYDLVAANRQRLFAAPQEACPLVPASLRPRFVMEPETGP